MAFTATRQQPPWKQPTGTTPHPNLKIYNSLTRQKEKFIPSKSDQLTWYACGPTVYDDAHLGHARNYVSTDILRRLFRDYFKFNVKFVMNITDVDDKIILRGRQRHLYEEWKKHHRYVQVEEIDTAKGAYTFYVRKHLPRILDVSGNPPPPVEFKQWLENSAYVRILNGQALDHTGSPGDAEAKLKMHIATATNAVKAITSDPKMLTPYAFYELVNDVMCPMLDQKYSGTIKGSDHAIFTKLTQEYEKHFFQDMQALNVLEPDEITRVTEFGQPIAQFVDTIVKNKFAYATSDGSVYFDIEAFKASGYPYARLKPENVGDKALQADGEGSLTQKTSEKRSDADFALWKASKPGEPSWSSPWGEGRPGWHIECSAMASAKFGEQMDIHSGGIDLAFPHHDNELAQSEAFWQSENKGQWVNYFLHMGHLSIAGSKMSKSLKNFTTIKTALDRKDWTARSLRIIFLLGKWVDGIEITDGLRLEGANWEDKVDNFFLNTIASLESSIGKETPTGSPTWPELEVARKQVDDALLDSFNTPDAMIAISSLITKFNSANQSSLTIEDFYGAAHFVTKMVNIFGLNGSGPAEPRELGWKGIEIPDIAKPYVLPLAEMRDDLRKAAIAKNITPETVESIVSKGERPQNGTAHDERSSRPYANLLEKFSENVKTVTAPSDSQPLSNGETKAKDPNKEVLALCDKVRDIDLWNLNIYLEDRDNLPALVRPVNAGLRQAREEKEGKARAKEEERKKRDKEKRERDEKGRQSHLDMFQTREFAAWDADGIPTFLAHETGPGLGQPISESRKKKLRKEWERQKKAHEKWCSDHPKEAVLMQLASNQARLDGIIAAGQAGGSTTGAAGQR